MIYSKQGKKTRRHQQINLQYIVINFLTLEGALHFYLLERKAASVRSPLQENISQ